MMALRANERPHAYEFSILARLGLNSKSFRFAEPCCSESQYLFANQLNQML